MKYYPGKSMVVLVPYPAQGHVTPMLRLASILAQRGGVQPVLIVPDFIHNRISSQIDPSDGIVCMSIPFGPVDNGDQAQECRHHFFAVEEAMEKNMPVHLEALLIKLNKDEGGSRVACVAVDLLASYAIGVGNRLGIPVAGFWPASFATYRLISSIPHLLEAGIISDTGCPLDAGPICLGPGHPTMSPEELPWLIGHSSARKSRFKFWNRTMSRSNDLPFLLINSFPQECFTHNHDDSNFNFNNSPNIVPIQPPCINTHAVEIKKASFWEEDLSCLDWLNNQTTNSVIYVSFGSWVTPLGETKIKDLALALEASNAPFLWVISPSWLQSLPIDYEQRVSRKGQAKIVSWAPQMEVLQHKSVGFYLSHCGWNSTMEAIYCKKPLLCWPIAGVQFLNSAYIVQKWGIGIRIEGFGQKDLEVALRRISEDCEVLKEGISMLNERFIGKMAFQKPVDYLASFIDNVLCAARRRQPDP